VFSVRYELCVYIPEGGILHSHRRETPRRYAEFTSVSCAFVLNENWFSRNFGENLPIDSLGSSRRQSRSGAGSVSCPPLHLANGSHSTNEALCLVRVPEVYTFVA
jgi:hypothetical protein